jgi:hypothetical protein
MTQFAIAVVQVGHVSVILMKKLNSPNVAQWEPLMEAKIIEKGNGFAKVGQYVANANHDLFRVVDISGPIHTGRDGRGNYTYAEVELADWADISPAEYPKCDCEVLID